MEVELVVSSFDFSPEILEAPAPVSREPAALRMRTIAPCPFQGSAAIRFETAAPGTARVQILDVTGRLRRTLRAGQLAAGLHEVIWDGRDDRGAELPAGLYWCRVSLGGRVVSGRVLRVR
jgi:hypothetical protein